MKKWVHVVNSKILPKAKIVQDKSIKPQRFLNSHYRKEKLRQKVPMKFFPSSYQSSLHMFAASNLDGTQFVLKQSSQKLSMTQNSQSDKVKEQIQIPNKEQGNKSQISGQIEQRFREMISQINQSLRELYKHKKSLLQELPFEINIDLVLGILVVFGLGLGAFVIFEEKNYSLEGSSSYTYIFFGFLIFLILMAMVNVLYVFFQSYEFFNFDYEVMNIVTHQLIGQNESFFRKKEYTLVCDIQTTWIMLKPLSPVSNVLQNQYHSSDNF